MADNSNNKPLPLGPSSPKQQRAVEAFEKVQILVLGGARFGGKVQPYSSVVQTKFGSKKLEDIKTGDKILNPNGTEQKVIAVHPHKDHQFYKVTFDDGSTTYCGMEHLWVAWRSSKDTKKSKKLDRLYGKPDQDSLYPNDAEVISLEGIQDWLDRGYGVHIPVTRPLAFTGTSNNVFDPYLLGYLIGDGCLTSNESLGITRHPDDNSLDAELLKRGFHTHPIPSCKLALKFDTQDRLDVLKALTTYGLIGTYSDTKFIPPHYLKCPITVRLDLLRGLMDSDGYIDDRGHLEFSTTSERLSKDFIDLVRGLGGKCTVNTKIGSYKDKQGNKVECKLVYRHYFRMPSDCNPFILERKASKFKQKDRLYHSIKSIEKAFVADGCCITVSDPNRLYVTDDCIVTHNSYLGAMLTTLYADDPNARIAFFRDTLESMKRGGQIIDTVKSVYSQIEDQCRLVVGGNPPVGKILSGPGAGERKGQGARIEFLPMSHESDMEKIRGSSFSLAVIEEAIPNFSQDQIEFIMSCLRSNAKRESKLVMTCNPMESHFICSLIKDYYLDEDGYPIDGRCGNVRYFYKYLGDYYWGDSRQEVYDLVTELGAFSDADMQTIPLEDKLNRILSFSFVQLTAYDNPIGMKANPGYMAMLESMNAVQKARNLKGCWFAKEEGKGFFNREWLRGELGQRVKSVQDIPKGCVAVRAIDKAYSECSDSSPDPDYSALSPLLLKDRDGFYWILGNYHPRITDEKVFRKSDKPCLGRFRKLSGERDNLVALQLNTDIENSDAFGYQKPMLALAKDSGGGSGDYYSTLARMAEEGIKVLKDQSISNVKGKKVADFNAFTSACQTGIVYIVEDTFDQHTLNTWYKELEDFDGSPSTRTRKDDFVDATALAFNCIRSAKRPYQTLVRNQQVVETLSAHLYKN